jgi:hypothetical protein
MIDVWPQPSIVSRLELGSRSSTVCAPSNGVDGSKRLPTTSTGLAGRAGEGAEVAVVVEALPDGARARDPPPDPAEVPELLIGFGACRRPERMAVWIDAVRAGDAGETLDEIFIRDSTFARKGETGHLLDRAQCVAQIGGTGRGADDFEEGRLVPKLVTSGSLLNARALSRLCGACSDL